MKRFLQREDIHPRLYSALPPCSIIVIMVVVMVMVMVMVDEMPTAHRLELTLGALIS